LTVLNVEAALTDADDVEDLRRRTIPEIQENEKTAQEDPWTVQNAPGRNAETEPKHLKAVMKLNVVVVVEVVVVADDLARGGASSNVEALAVGAQHAPLIETTCD